MNMIQDSGKRTEREEKTPKCTYLQNTALEDGEECQGYKPVHRMIPLAIVANLVAYPLWSRPKHSGC